MDNANIAQIQMLRLIEEKEWLVGGVNFDEDLHFASYYLRASCIGPAELQVPTYSRIIGVYNQFTETYYVPADECVAVAEELIQRAISDTLFLPTVLKRITAECDVLNSIFDGFAHVTDLADLPTAELSALYEYHHKVHTNLYAWARIPEALDRGVQTFTNFLKEYLSTVLNDTAAVDEHFILLTKPSRGSILSQFLREKRDLQTSIANSLGRDYVRQVGTRAIMLLPYPLRRRLEIFAEQWSSVAYHGYGNRALSDVHATFRDLIETMGHTGHLAPLDLLENPSIIERDNVFDRLNISGPHRTLFESYAEIGLVKLYRRIAQLRNFIWLDALLGEIAKRLGCSEWALRCLLPEEVLTALSVGQAFPEAESRSKNSAFLISKTDSYREYVLGDPGAKSCRQALRDKRVVTKVSGNLTGTVASRGIVTGEVYKVLRATDYTEPFPDGGILVSGSTDPDLISLIERAGAVLTQEGGVTSHASLICRELGVPCIVGITGLLEEIDNGLIVHVDAYKGTVTRLHLNPDDVATRYLIAESARNLANIGNKASNLIKLQEHGFHVPRFTVLRYDSVASTMESGDSAKIYELCDWLKGVVQSWGANTIAIRSSTISEDSLHNSEAGRFKSVISVPTSNLESALQSFFSGNKGLEYNGSILVQEMINPYLSGVCLTQTRGLLHDAMVIELSVGHNFSITEGSGVPLRIIFDRSTGEIIDQNFIPSEYDINLDTNQLFRTFHEVEHVFETSLDIEWAVLHSEIYVLQARPIVDAKSHKGI